MRTDPPVNPNGAVFATTHWSVVMLAARQADPAAGEALASLCRSYWSPIHAFIRRQGHDTHDAEDLTQEFFAKLLQKSWLSQVDARKGKFRSFLLASLKHFLANEWDRAQAAKRGGGHTFCSLQDSSVQEPSLLEGADPVSADKVFDRGWALALLDQTLAHLRQEFDQAGKLDLFEALKGCLTGDRSTPPYADVGRTLGISEVAVKVTVHRMRQRYGALLRAEISRTVSRPEDVDEELRYLAAVLA